MNIMNAVLWSVAIVFIVLYFLYLFKVIPKHKHTAWTSFFVLVPPLFYGLAYFVVFKEQKTYIKELSEVWGPFWAASAALLLTVIDHQSD